MRDSLETSRRAGTFLERRCNDVEIVAKRESTRDCCQRVVNVRWTNER